jgi:16S rRNA (uracil1498-N3)-methyltransferase
MIAALEQSAGGWLPEQIADAAPDETDVPPDAVRILLDVDGSPLLATGPLSSGAPSVVLFGPEGGVDAAERHALIAAGWKPVRLGGNTLRFETAGIAAVAVIRAAQVLSRS